MNARFLRRKKQRNLPVLLFCILSTASLAALLFFFYASHGDQIGHYFFYADLDTGMDFFHSIEYVRGRTPYTKFDTLYPPLANLFFYGLYLLIPKGISEQWANTFEDSIGARSTPIDLRVHQAPLLLFLLFLAAFVCLFLYLAEYLGNIHPKYLSRWACFCLLFSYGILMGIERGNVILYAMLLTMFFIAFEDSESAVLRELALISLALAAGLKLYPAFFGILLLARKKTAAAIRCVIYGTAAFFLPFFAFQDGREGIRIFFQQLIAHQSAADPSEAVPLQGSLAFLNGLLYPTMLLAGIFMVLLLASTFFLERPWQRVLAVTMAFYLFQIRWMPGYLACFEIIPLLCFFSEEGTMTVSSGVLFLLMIAGIVPFPIFYQTNAVNLLTAIQKLSYFAISAVLVVLMISRIAAGRMANARHA